MSISSEQYKTAIFELARRSIRVPYEELRVAYYDMMYRVLEHEGVTVDHDSYNGFREAIEAYLNYLSDAGLLTGDDIFHAEDFEARYDEFWGPAWAGIGITSTVTKDSSDGPASFSFTYPDGVNEVYKVGDYNTASPVELNIRFYSTLDYARKVMPYWAVQPAEDTVPLNELAGNRASFVTNWEEGGLYWSYSSERQEIEFTGEGELKMHPSYFTGNTNGLGLGTVVTAIYGAGVKALPASAFNWGAAGESRTVVCLHDAADAVTLGGKLATVGSSTNPYTLEIYCDNEAIRAGTFGDYVTVNWHTLAEWEG